MNLEELDSKLNSQVEQLESQIENEVRVIPKESDLGEKPVLVILGASEFTIGIFNGEQRTVPVIRLHIINNWALLLILTIKRKISLFIFSVHLLVKQR